MSTYTSSLGLEQITPGDQPGLWGNTTNNNLALIDQAVTGVTPISFAALSGQTYTLTDFDGAVDEARSSVLNITGIAAGSNTVVIPNKQKTYLVRNATGQDVVFRTPTPSATYTVGAGNSILIFCDGNNNVFTGIASPSVGTLGVAGGGTGQTTFGAGGFVKSTGGTNALTAATTVDLASDVSGILPVARGGTGAGTFTSGSLLVGNGTGNFGVLTGAAVGQVATWNGSTWTAAASASAGVTTFSGGTTGLLPNSPTSGPVTLTGTLAVTSGGTGATSATGARNNLGIGSVGTINTNGSTTQFLRGDGVFSSIPYPSAGIANSTGSAWGTSYGVSGTGTTVALTGNPTLAGATFTGAFIQQYTLNVTAVGTSQGTATAVNADNVYVSTATATVAPFNGIRLPAITVDNRKITVYNTSNNSINIYPPVSGFIDDNLVNVPVLLESGKQITFIGVGATWFSNYILGGATTYGLYSYARVPFNDGQQSQIKITTVDTSVTPTPLTGAKSLRVATYGDPNGALEIVNKAYTQVLFSLNDSGDLTIDGSTAQKASGTTWVNPSDARLKDNITNYTDGLSKLVQVQPKTWNYNGKGGTVAGAKGLGVVADEIQSVLPNTVSTYKAKLNPSDADYTDIKKFDATEITWLLVNSVKELKAELDAAKAEIAALKAK